MILVYIFGAITGIFAYIYIPKLIEKYFVKHRKVYKVSFTIMYFSHPTEVNKKGEFVRMKQITARVTGNDEESAIQLMKDIIFSDLKIEINSIEEIVDGQS